MNPIISILIIVCSFLLPTHSNAQIIYTWQDETGVLHFSDYPQTDNAKIITLTAELIAEPLDEKNDIEPPYKWGLKTILDQPLPELPSLAITLLNPVDQQTIRDNLGRIDVVVELSRPLTQDQQLQVILNDQIFGAPTASTSWQLNNIDRGQHKIMIQVIENGKVIASTQPVTVYLHRARLH